MEEREKIAKIEEIYQEYLKKLDDLRKEQNLIINDFVSELERAKMEEIKDKINNPNAAS